MRNLELFIDQLKSHSRFGKNIVSHRINPSRNGVLEDFPDQLHPTIKSYLLQEGISNLYSHQSRAFQQIMLGRNLLISTGVASGKSLCYQLPILHSLQTNQQMRALFLFPTKALTQDQNQKFADIIGSPDYVGIKATPGIYDGDTPKEYRKTIRSKAHLIFTNPDMLHLGILPHHTQWADFFKNLRYIIVDEVHIYRGIFGSHFANVIRRLKRIAAFYGSYPQFILTSATISNSKFFAEKLIEEHFEVIDNDGSPRGEQHMMIYNPPIVDQNLGIRRRSMLETIALAEQALEHGSQTLVFAHSRRMVEMILKFLQQLYKEPQTIMAYRSGYLAKERREIESRFRSGELIMTIATNALELGIDIGQLDIVLINGYPGSIASTLQQAGRAGRKGKASLAILIAKSDLLDQFLVQNPDYLYKGSPEEALIDPNNAFILLHHIKCAVFEKPFSSTESFGYLPPEKVDQYLKVLQKYGLLHKSGDKYYWRSDSYPADKVSLRTAGANAYILKSEDKIIGTVDQQSAFWFTHPNAIYLHNGESFIVQDLDIKQSEITLVPKVTDYYTMAQSRTEFELIKLQGEDSIKGGIKRRGQIRVTDQVTGYKRLKWSSNEVLGYENLDLPPSEMITAGFWISPSDEVVDKLKAMGLWKGQPNNYGSKWKEIAAKIRERDGHKCQSCGRSKDEQEKAFDVHHKKPFKSFHSAREANHPDNLITLCTQCHKLAEQQQYIQSCMAGLSWLLGNIAPFFLMCDRGDIRVQSDAQSVLAEGKSAVVIYDSVPGGIGLSERLFSITEKLLIKAASIVKNCSCTSGCPACVGPVAENGAGAKKDVIEMMKIMGF